MSSSSNRRQFLKFAGSGAALLSLTACGGGGDDESPGASQDRAADGEAMPPQPGAVESPSGLPATARLLPLTDDEPQAKALAYVSDASSVDAEAQPRFETGQACGNCALFMGADGDDRGPCSIFPGRLVAATGWCSVYAQKAG